jgi:hypothetical protein
MKLVGVAAVAVVLAVGMAGCIEDDPDDNGKVDPDNRGLVVEVTGENTTTLRGPLTAQLAWLTENRDARKTYTLEVNADQEISPYTFTSLYSDSFLYTIRLRGVGGNRSIRLSPNASGNMFTLGDGVNLVLENNITLQGRSSNNSGSMVYIDGRGASLTLEGGTITGHSTESNGGAVYVRWGTFVMQGGTISDNKATRGGGVYVFEDGANFDMRGGTITGNTATVQGGGVWLANSNSALFQKTGGTITGYDTDPENGNVVKDGSNVQTGMGHAIYRSADQRRETTVGPAVDRRHDREDGWDD